MRLLLKNTLWALLFFYVSLSAQQTASWYFKRGENLTLTKPDSALICYKKAISLLNDDPKREEVAACYGRIGTILTDRSDFQNGFESYLKLLNWAEANKDTLKQINACNNISIILNQQRKYDQSIAYVNRSLVMARISHHYWEEMNALINMADMLASIGKSDSSIIVLREAEKIAGVHHFDGDVPNILMNLGNIYYGKGSINKDKKFYRMAIECAQKAINLTVNMKDPSLVKGDYRKDLAYSYGLKGAALSELGNYAEAEQSYHKAINYYLEQHDMFDLSYLYYELTTLYVKAGQKEKSLIYLERYDSISKILYTKENTRAVSDMQTKYETEKKEQQNKALKTENELSAKTIRQQTIITYVIIAGLALTLALAYFIFRGLKQQRLANQIISEQKNKVEGQQKEIIDSIHYARRIQQSLLPTTKYIEKRFNDLKNKKVA